MNVKESMTRQTQSMIVGSFVSMVTNPLETAVVTAVTKLHPDPAINVMTMACNGCPYCLDGFRCEVKNCTWRRYLTERRVYNSLPEERRSQAEEKYLQKQSKKKGKGK